MGLGCGSVGKHFLMVPKGQGSIPALHQQGTMGHTCSLGMETGRSMSSSSTQETPASLDCKEETEKNVASTS